MFQRLVSSKHSFILHILLEFSYSCRLSKPKQSCQAKIQPIAHFYPQKTRHRQLSFHYLVLTSAHCPLPGASCGSALISPPPPRLPTVNPDTQNLNRCNENQYSQLTLDERLDKVCRKLKRTPAVPSKNVCPGE